MPVRSIKMSSRPSEKKITRWFLICRRRSNWSDTTCALKMRQQTMVSNFLLALDGRRGALGTVRGGYLLFVTFVDLVDHLVDDLDRGPLVVLAGSLLNELNNLILIHSFFLGSFDEENL